jgi:protein-S-isoprenylcysteine O-methyltransferase Ste14
MLDDSSGSACTDIAAAGRVLTKPRPSQPAALRAGETKSAATDRSDIPAVIAFPPMLYGGAFALGVGPRWLWPEPVLPSVISVGIGMTLLCSGAALAVWGNHALREAGTNANPSLPTTTLVVTGPFAFSRNPLYVARTLLYVGLALTMNMLWTLVTLLPLLVVMHYGVIRREERYLEAKFGSAYRRYRTTVRRWL